MLVTHSAVVELSVGPIAHIKVARATSINLSWKCLSCIHMPYRIGQQLCCERIRKGHSRETRLCFVRPRVGIPIMHGDQPYIEEMPSGLETRNHGL